MRSHLLRTALATSLLLSIAAPAWPCGSDMGPPASGPASGPADNPGPMNNNGGDQGAGGGSWSNGGGDQGGGGGSWNNGGGEQMRQGVDDTTRTDLGDDGGGGGRRSQGGGGQGGGSQNFTSQISALGASQANGGGGGGGLPAVWCLMQRQGPDGNQEQTVIRCDNMAGAGPGWRPVSSNMDFTTASAARDSFNAGNPATVWCLMQRMRDDGTSEQTVIRCDNMAGAGPGWRPISSNLDFTTASAARDSFNAANPPK